MPSRSHRLVPRALASLLALAAVAVGGCESDCPDDQTTAVILRILGSAAIPSDTTFDIAVFAYEQYELVPGEAPRIDEDVESQGFIEIADVGFVAEGTTVLVTPRCNDSCRRFLARLTFRRRPSLDPVATAWLETGYRDESFTEFRWLIPSQLVTPTTPCNACAPDQTCRGVQEATFNPECEPIAIDRCMVPPLGSGLSYRDFAEPGCSATCN